MVSKQVVQVILEAEEKVSKAAKKAEEALKKMSNNGNRGLSKLTGVASKIQSGFSKISSYVDRAREKFNQLKSSSDKLGMIKSTISNAATSFGSLIKNSELASKAIEKIKSVSDTVQTKFTNLKGKITSFGSSVKSSLTSAFSLSGIKEKLSNLGTSVDNLKTKLKNLGTAAKNAGGGAGLGFLRNAASMTVGMLGYDLVNSIMESTRASLNARSSIQAYGTRLNMTGAEVQSFQSSLDNLQGTFKKVDMDVVGQQAMDLAYRLGLPKTALTELTETSAIFNDAMQRNGRSAEDATLALADAMDGEFRRLKEVGISQEDLMNNGWSGDLQDKEGLLNAINKSLKNQHYDELAKGVDNLDDAWKVLTVTLSNLLESIILPLTPAIVGVITGFTSAIETIKNAWNSLPDFAQLGIGVGVVVAAIILVASVLWTTYIPAWIAAAAATWAAIAPVLPIVLAIGAAVALVVVAIYEVGKAFGWWSDVGSMFEAIKAGIMRMWEAFINHPDVQAAIQIIGNALQTLGSWIQQAGQAIMEFFGIATGGEWDIVGQIIHNVGQSWENTKMVISTVVGVVQAVIGAFQWFYGVLVQIGTFLSGIFAPAFTIIGELFTILLSQIQPIVDVFNQFMAGQTSLVSVITTVGSTLLMIWTNLNAYLSNLVLSLVTNLLTWAIQAGLNFLTGIATYLMQVPTRVNNYLTQTWSRINSMGARWVSTARQKASQLLNGVISFLRQLPGRALSELLRVVSSIVSAGSQWVSNAKAKASEVVSNVVSTLSGLPGKIASALSGVVSAIVSPFQNAYNKLCGVVDAIKAKASEVTGLAFGGETAYGGELAFGGETLSSISGDENTLASVIDINHNLNLNLENVPSHIDTETLIQMLTSKEVLEGVVLSSEYQAMDKLAKTKDIGRYNRARGI